MSSPFTRPRVVSAVAIVVGLLFLCAGSVSPSREEIDKASGVPYSGSIKSARYRSSRETAELGSSRRFPPVVRAGTISPHGFVRARAGRQRRRDRGTRADQPAGAFGNRARAPAPADSDPRRDRHGQGSPRPHHPPLQRPGRRTVRGRQLRAIPETLLEAELFGFERGAFTDARQAKAGPLPGGERRHHVPGRGRTRCRSPCRPSY